MSDLVGNPEDRFSHTVPVHNYHLGILLSRCLSVQVHLLTSPQQSLLLCLKLEHFASVVLSVALRLTMSHI